MWIRRPERRSSRRPPERRGRGRSPRARVRAPLPAPAPPRRRRPRRTLWLAAAALVAAAGLSAAVAITLVAVLGGATHPSPALRRAAVSWDEAARQAFGPLVGAAPNLSSQTADWQAQRITDTAYLADLDTAAAAVASTVARARALPPSPAGALVGQMAVDSALLYGDAVRIDRTTVTTPAGSLRAGLELMARRVSELSNRVFDRGRALLAADLPPSTPTPGLVEHLPTDVPLWQAEGEAAAPPLAATAPPSPPRYPPLKERARPRQADASWRRAVTATGAPSQPAVAAMEGAGAPSGAQTVAALQAAAGALVGASDALGHIADPVTGGAERSDRFRLGLLCDADALFAAEAADLAGGDAATPLEQVAADLAAVGGELRAGAA